MELKTQLYVGCHSIDDRHASWNSAMYKLIHREQALLRAKGYRTIMLAKNNGHAGNKQDEGIEGNHPDVNKNFLHGPKMKHVNGQKHLVKGCLTRQ